MRVYVEYPYDVGSPHLLRGEDGSKAVISAVMAGELVASGLPTEAPGKDPQGEPRPLCRGCVCNDPRLSKKAKLMLGVKW